jgi:hypothetical protein
MLALIGDIVTNIQIIIFGCDLIATIEALKDKPRTGKPTTLPSHMEQKFCRRIAKGSSKQDGVSVLNGPAIKRLLEREFCVIPMLGEETRFRRCFLQ